MCSNSRTKQDLNLSHFPRIFAVLSHLCVFQPSYCLSLSLFFVFQCQSLKLYKTNRFMEQLHNIFHLYYYLRNFPCLDQIFSSSKILPTLLILCKDKTKEWSSKNTYPTPTKNMPNKIIAFSKASFLESPYPPFPCILSSHKPPQKRKKRVNFQFPKQQKLTASSLQLLPFPHIYIYIYIHLTKGPLGTYV